MINTSKLITIDSFISQEERKYPEANGEFTKLIHDLVFAVRIIAKDVRRAGINNILGLTNNQNASGDMVRKLDQYANDVIINVMKNNYNILCLASEENESIIALEHNDAKYFLVFDPLDGSSNIDVSITIGTIFALYKIDDLDPDFIHNGILPKGSKQVLAAYALYGSSTILTYTTGESVNTFTYDPSVGEFLLTFENLKIPEFGAHFSCNMANFSLWSPEIQRYINTMQNNQSPKFTFRYVATAVADIHRTLHFGGIYMYPAQTNKPNGKIRLLYEANPLAMIVENAGGLATNGSIPILDILPDSIHQSVPFFIGSPNNIMHLNSLSTDSKNISAASP